MWLRSHYWLLKAELEKVGVKGKLASSMSQVWADQARSVVATRKRVVSDLQGDIKDFKMPEPEILLTSHKDFFLFVNCFQNCLFYQVLTTSCWQTSWRGRRGSDSASHSISKSPATTPTRTTAPRSSNSWALRRISCLGCLDSWRRCRRELTRYAPRLLLKSWIKWSCFDCIMYAFQYLHLSLQKPGTFFFCGGRGLSASLVCLFMILKSRPNPQLFKSSHYVIGWKIMF